MRGTHGCIRGDIGYRDADGYLFLVDRKTDLIKTSGYQVWPQEIEDLPYAPGGGEVGVAKMLDAVKGEVAKAWVVLRPGTSTTAARFAPTAASTSPRTRCRASWCCVMRYPGHPWEASLRRLLGDIPDDQHGVESDDARAIT